VGAVSVNSCERVADVIAGVRSYDVLMSVNNNNVRGSIRNIGCLQIFSSLLGSWR
jgi:hypothetical protein